MELANGFRLDPVVKEPSKYFRKIILLRVWVVISMVKEIRVEKLVRKLVMGI